MNFDELYNEFKNNGGFTFDRANNRLDNSANGYLVSLAEYNVQFALTGFSVDYIIRYFFETPQNALIGVWLDTDTDIVHLDCNVHCTTITEAIRVGIENDQIAIWDCEYATAIKIDNLKPRRLSATSADNVQSHSVGDIYPLTISFIGDAKRKEGVWRLWIATTGQVIREVDCGGRYGCGWHEANARCQRAATLIGKQFETNVARTYDSGYWEL